MPRALFISYEFPPSASAQAQAAAKLAKGLAESGWDLEVLAVLDPPTRVRDERLLSELPKTVGVHRAYSLEPTRIVQFIREAKARFRRRGEPHVGQSPGTDTPQRHYTSLPRPVVRLAKAVFNPDERVGWTPWAVREASRIHDREAVDLVIADGPPYSTYGVGWRVAARLGVPFVAVLMDPIVGCEVLTPLTPLNATLIRRYEAKVVARADRILIASDLMREELVERHPEASERVTAIPNAFDPADFLSAAPPPHEGFTLCFVGLFTATRRPDVLLQAVARLIQEDSQFADDVRVRFVGPRSAEADSVVRKLGLEGAVVQTGLLSHDEAIREMRSADVLLVFLAAVPENRVILTSKLPEYLAAGKAVLALVPEGAVADTVLRTHAGEVAPPDDPDAVAEALLRMHRQWKSGKLPTPDPDVVKEFGWDVQLATVDKLLSDLVQS